MFSRLAWVAQEPCRALQGSFKSHFWIFGEPGYFSPKVDKNEAMAPGTTLEGPFVEGREHRGCATTASSTYSCRL